MLSDRRSGIVISSLFSICVWVQLFILTQLQSSCLLAICIWIRQCSCIWHAWHMVHLIEYSTVTLAQFLSANLIPIVNEQNTFYYNDIVSIFVVLFFFLLQNENVKTKCTEGWVAYTKVLRYFHFQMIHLFYYYITSKQSYFFFCI